MLRRTTKARTESPRGHRGLSGFVFEITLADTKKPPSKDGGLNDIDDKVLLHEDYASTTIKFCNSQLNVKRRLIGAAVLFCLEGTGTFRMSSRIWFAPERVGKDANRAACSSQVLNLVRCDPVIDRPPTDPDHLGGFHD